MKKFRKLTLIVLTLSLVVSAAACSIFDTPSKERDQEKNDSYNTQSPNTNSTDDYSSDNYGYSETQNSYNYTSYPDSYAFASSVNSYSGNIIDKGGFSFVLPFGWTESDMSGVTIYRAPNNTSNLNIITEDLPYNLSAEEYWNAGKGYLESVYNDLSIISTDRVTIGNDTNGFYSCFKASQENILLNFYQFYSIKNNTAYVITFAEISGSVDYSDDLSSIIDSFRIK